MPHGPEVPHLDKIVHALLYAAGAFTLANARALSRSPTPRLYIGCAMVIMLIGALDELYQLRTLGRTGADVFDWLADAIGAWIVCGGLLLLRKRQSVGQ